MVGCWVVGVVGVGAGVKGGVEDLERGGGAAWAALSKPL